MDDLPLIVRGKISCVQLVTLRKGELTFDPVLGELVPLEQEVVKIAGINSPKYPWHCVLHSQDGCRLHPLRPVQCKALFCQDASGIQDMYTKDRAERKHIFHALARAGSAQGELELNGQNHDTLPLVQMQLNMEGWLELAHAHEEECPLLPLIALTETVFLRHELDMEVMENAEVVRLAEEKILQGVRYDLAYRDLCVQKAGVAHEFLPCLLGRPVHVFLRSLGITFYTNSQGELSVRSAKKGIYFNIINQSKPIE